MKKKLFCGLLMFFLTYSCVFAAIESGYGFSLNKTVDDVIVQEVIPNSAADKSGLKVGQKIIKFNGKKTNKIKESDIKDIDLYKTLKIVTDDNKKHILKPENITLLRSYNKIQETYNENTKYKVNDYKTEKIILARQLGNKHAKYTNAYLNYADAISIENSKLYVNLFKVTNENVKSALKESSNNKDNPYVEIYNSIYQTNKKHDIYGEAFRQFLELSIYNEENIELINRQISEFNSLQKKQFAQLTYNTRIVANLYSYANRELGVFLVKNTINANLSDNWENELKNQNTIYNGKYNELCNLLSKNKIKINKPGPLSNREQINAGTVPNVKWAEDKQIVLLAQEKGYNPNNHPIVKKINDEKIAAQKQAEKQQAMKKASNKKPNTSTAKSNNIFNSKIDPSKVKRTNNYPLYYYKAAKSCESKIKVGLPVSEMVYCLAQNLRNPYNYMDIGYQQGTLPFIFAAVMQDFNNFNHHDPAVMKFMSTMFPVTLIEFGNTLNKSGAKIDTKAYNFYMYGKK